MARTLFEKWFGIFNFDTMHSYNEIIIIANTITLNKIWDICYMSFTSSFFAITVRTIKFHSKKKNVPRINEGFFFKFSIKALLGWSWSSHARRPRSIGLSDGTCKKTHMPRSDNARVAHRASSAVRSSKTRFFLRLQRLELTDSVTRNSRVRTQLMTSDTQRSVKIQYFGIYIPRLTKISFTTIERRYKSVHRWFPWS